MVLQLKLLAFYNDMYIPALLLKLNGAEAMEVEEEGVPEGKADVHSTINMVVD